MKVDDALRYNWDKIVELSPRINEEEVFRKVIFLYKDIISRTPYEWERKRAEESLKWLLQQRNNKKTTKTSTEAKELQDTENLESVENYRIDKNTLKKISYNDIGGLKHAISKIREIVELPFKHPEIFRKLGIEPAKGVLLYGPPGCGKTLLAKAVANESDAAFFYIAGPEIMSKYYGEAEKRLRQIFEEARKNAPAIIFFDELDALAPARQKASGDVEKRIVAQLLTLMDGLRDRGQVIVIGATNNVDLVDPALRRPGRFDREIEVGLPDLDGRLEILRIHSKSMPLAEDVDLQSIAIATRGFTGAELKAVCEEAAYECLRRHQKYIESEGSIPDDILNNMEVTANDFEIAVERVRQGTYTNPNIEVRTSWDSFLKKENSSSHEIK